MPKNILISGLPKSGKTTLIKKLINKLKISKGGFYTEEIREGGVRKGFSLNTLDGREGVLSHIDIKSRKRVGRYKVNLKDLEDIGVKAVREAIIHKDLIVVDEIGKMELYSAAFKEVIIEALDSKKKFLGTIMLKSNKFTPLDSKYHKTCGLLRDKHLTGFTDRIKKRKDIVLLELRPENREFIEKKVEELLF